MKVQISRMADQLAHRGPDDSGAWVDAKAGVALGHRRLSILDLSCEGHQPMQSAGGRYVISFNGEVYNFCALRRELEPKGHRFRGHSDTEVMLAAITEWGLEAAVKNFAGMFAFALWDRQERALHLVRDRLGIKPLYYGWAGKAFLFGSELKALRVHPDFIPEVNRDAVALQLRYGYIPHPYSVYRGVSKLPQGHILTVKSNPSAAPGSEKLSAFWSAKEVAERGYADPSRTSEADILQELDLLLKEIVGAHMVADVPLGAFLSGGIDSSTVVALMQSRASRPVRTFTIGFCEDDFNEAAHAKAVASHLGTEHTELYVTPQEARAVIPKLPNLYDEPFSDVSQIPTFLVSALAKSQVTVGLSGDGGDEVFGGYTHHIQGPWIWNRIGWLPQPLRRGMGALMKTISPTTYSRRMGWLSPMLSKFGGSNPVGDKMYKVADVLAVPSPEALYCRFVSHWKEPEKVVIGAHEPMTAVTDVRQHASVSESASRMMFLDLISYLPDDILTKVDRASMGVSLEVRVPLLDHRVVEFAARIPLEMKIRDGSGKWVLRRVLNRYVPRELTARPKMGFGVPIGEWLRGGLRDWAEDLLDEGRLRREGFLFPQPVRTIWTEHLSGQRDWKYCLWDVLMFEAWLMGSGASSKLRGT